MSERVCQVEGCGRPHDARGFCSTHRQRWLRHGDPNAKPRGPQTCQLDGCDRERNAHGWCQMHYRRIQQSGEPGDVRSRYALTIEERLECYSDKSGDCWIYTPRKSGGTYGTMVDGDGNSDRVHRIAYRLFVGPIPDGMFVCHRCDNPPCWKPEHLFLGTVADNNRDMFAKGRGHRLAPPLSDEQVAAIYELADTGISGREVARRLGMNRHTVAARLYRRSKVLA